MTTRRRWQAGERTFTAGPGQRGGEAGGGRAGSGGGDDGAAGGGGRDLPGLHGLVGAAARAGGDCGRGGGAGGGDHPGGVLLGHQGGDPERSIAPVEGPAPLIADLASFSVVSEPIHRQW